MHFSSEAEFSLAQQEAASFCKGLGTSNGERVASLLGGIQAAPLTGSDLPTNPSDTPPVGYLASGHRLSAACESEAEATDAHNVPLPSAALSTRTYNALLKGRITTIGQFCALKIRDLHWLRNVGKKAVAEVIAYRSQLGVPMEPLE